MCDLISVLSSTQRKRDTERALPIEKERVSVRILQLGLRGRWGSFQLKRPLKAADWIPTSCLCFCDGRSVSCTAPRSAPLHSSHSMCFLFPYTRLHDETWNRGGGLDFKVTLVRLVGYAETCWDLLTYLKIVCETVQPCSHTVITRDGWCDCFSNIVPQRWRIFVLLSI